MFGSIRSYNIANDIKLLEGYIDKLDGRINLLKTSTEMSKLYNDNLFDSDSHKKISDLIIHDDDCAEEGEIIVHNKTLLESISLETTRRTDL